MRLSKIGIDWGHPIIKVKGMNKKTIIEGYSLDYNAQDGGFVSTTRRGTEYGASIGALEMTGGIECYNGDRFLAVPESTQEKILNWESECFDELGRDFQ